MVSHHSRHHHHTMQESPPDPLTTTVVPSTELPKPTHYICKVVTASIVLTVILFTFPLLVSVLFPSCREPNCFDIISEMSTSIDPSINPCDNFYKYVCSGWRQNYPTDVHNLGLLRRRIHHSLFQTLTYYETANASDAVDIAATYFQSCTRVALKGDKPGTETLRRFLDHIGVPWPSVRSAWRAGALELLVKLSLDWGIAVVFDLSIVPNFKTNKGAILHLEESMVLYEWIIERTRLGGFEAVGAYIKELAQILGDPRVDYASFAEKLALVDLDILSMALENKFQISARSPSYVKFGELHTFTGPLIQAHRWIVTINRHLPEDRPISSDDSIFVSDTNVFTRIESLLAHYLINDRASIIVMYIVFHVIRQLAPYTSLRLASLPYALTSSAHSRSRLYQVFLLQCYSSVTEHMGHAIAWMFVEKWVAEKTRLKVAGLAASIRDVTHRSFEDVDWMDGETRQQALRKITMLREIIGLPEHLVSRGAVNRFYRYVPSHREPFLATLLDVKRAEMNRLKDAFATERKMRREDIPVSLVAANAYYVSVYHIIVIPAGLMFSPFYVIGGRDSLNYGGLGHIVGHEIMHVFDPEHGLLDETGLIVDWYSDYSKAKFHENTECLKQMYNNASGNNETTLGESALSENFADCAGLLQAYRTFREALAKPLDPATMALSSGTIKVFSEEQLFFLSSCYKWCGWDGFSSPNYSPLSLRCNVPLMNMPEFSEAFHCAPGSVMNPSLKCTTIF
ncbi:neprilysin-like [Ornithodoros turicata]|uniref:neprilysin-like n=1 Tax=Ornithodoros turicata TaxID=34597 RepID=UPI00313948C8